MKTITNQKYEIGDVFRSEVVGKTIHSKRSTRRPEQFVVSLDLKRKVALCSGRQNGSYLICFLPQEPKNGQSVKITGICAKNAVGILI